VNTEYYVVYDGFIDSVEYVSLHQCSSYHLHVVMDVWSDGESAHSVFNRKLLSHGLSYPILFSLTLHPWTSISTK
jgi:hypothetical protein